MRCFVAVDLDPALRGPLLRLLQELPRTRAVRWCAENQLHVTLKFLGEVSDAQIPRINDALANASSHIEPFYIRLGGLGCFPSPRNPRVLWAGIEDPGGGCAGWMAAADPLLSELGFERETRAYTPHVTLGRSKGRGGGEVIQEVLGRAANLPGSEMTVEQVVLFESRLLPRGAQYIPVSKLPLGGG